MSSQRGNAQRTRAQKHKNANAFKNNMHDTTKKIQMINSLDVVGCCARCKDCIEWKIKYKKYKPLTVPKKCTSCQEKCVKRAYYMLCDGCLKSTGRCGKCGQNAGHVLGVGLSAAEEVTQRAQLEQELKLLPERKRRTFLRAQESGKFDADNIQDSKDDDDDAEDTQDSEDEEDRTGGDVLDPECDEDRTGDVPKPEDKEDKTVSRMLAENSLKDEDQDISDEDEDS